MSTRSNAGRLLLAAMLSSCLGFAHAATKEEQHNRMIELQAQMAAVKGNPSSDAQQRFAEYQSELLAISAALGGDLPCAEGPASAPAVRGAVPVPTNCTPTTLVVTQNTPVNIPTGPAVVTSTLLVAGAQPYLWDVNLTTFITHTFAADLDITISSPAGTVVTLTTDNGAGNDNVFNGTVWDDSANPAGQVPYVTNNGLVTDHAYVNLTLASPLVPEEALAAFVGEDPNGTWTITISDDLAGDGGDLNSWSLELTTFAAAPIISAPVVFNQPTPAAIDTGPSVATSTLLVSGLPNPVCNLNLRTNIAHTFAADLDITLTSPAGTVVTLTTDNGAGNDDVFNGTVWNDKANPAGQVPYVTNNGLTTDHAYVNVTLASPLVPEESLGAFLGEDGNGTWTLTISDDLAGDGGNLDGWGLDIQTCTCAAGNLTITPAAVDFGNVGIGATSAPQIVTLGNTGTAALQVSAITAAAAPFALSGGSCGATPINLAAAASCTLEYTFSPAAAGAANQAFTVTADAPGDTAFSLAGNGTAIGNVTITPALVDFGVVSVGVTSAPLSVTLGNSGSAALQVTAITAAAAPFALSGGTCGATPISLGIGASCTLEYTFAPAAAGVVNQIFTVTADAPGATSFTLTGEGTASGVLTLSTPTLAFGGRPIGGTATLTLTISNTGNGPLNVNSISAATAPFSGPTAGTCGAAPFVLAAGTSCTVNFSFAPVVVGAANQLITIDSNGGAGTVNLTGSGFAPIALPSMNQMGLLVLLLVFGVGGGLWLRRQT